MANQITDNRTLIDAANAVTNFDDLTGGAAGTQDTEIKYQGTASVSEYLGSTLSGLMYDAGTAQNWASNTFYILINCGIVGLLDTKAAGGFRIRFAGNTATDWFEVYVAGSDEWPASFSGGWTQFVVDIETARADAVTNGWTNGTTPATSAIRYVGWAGVTGGTMPRMVDNTWMDEIRRLPDGSPGIIVEGRNGGTTDWNWDDVISNAATGEWGTCRTGAGGAVVINTPIQFGENDTVTHGFTDTNRTILWENQEFLADDIYSFSFVGNAGGTTNVTGGISSGSGDDRTGAQGWIVQSAGNGPRWSFDATDANLDNIDFYGCSFIHGASFSINSSIVEFIGNTFLDCSSAQIDNSVFIRNTVVDANTADGVAFVTTDDLSDVKFCDFTFSDGHAIEITSNTVTPQASKGNAYTGYGADASNDAAIFNDAGGSLTINITDGGDTPTTRTTSGTTTVNNAVNITLTNLIAGSRVWIYNDDDSLELFNEVEATTTFADTINYTTDKAITVRVRNSTSSPYYKTFQTSGTITSSGYSAVVNQELDE